MMMSMMEAKTTTATSATANERKRKQKKKKKKREKEIRTVLSQLYNNRAFAALNLGNNKRCVEDAEKCLEIDATNIKAYFRAYIVRKTCSSTNDV